MIEIMVTHGGSADLPMRETNGTLVPDADLEGIQESTHRTLIGQIRQGILADRLGYDVWYQTEHHFQPEAIEFNPNPLMAQMAIAAHTKRIRLGQAANIITWHHPIRFAEQIAILDVVSGGRVDVGIGRGYQARELETIGRTYGASALDQERLRGAFEEAFEIILKAWTEPSFSHHGDIYSFPPKWLRWNNSVTDAYFEGDVGRDKGDVLGPGGILKELTVYPQPLQKPHPPLWQPMASPRSIIWAAENGINGHYQTESNIRLKPKLEAYHAAAEKAGWPDYLDRGEFKFGWDAEKRRGQVPGRWIHIVQNGVGNLEKATRGMQQQWDFYRNFGFGALLADPGETPLDAKDRVPPEYLRERGIVLFGSAEYIAQEILRTKEECGYGEDFAINLFFEMNGLTTAELEEQMTAFAEEVMPILRQECGGAPELPASTVDLGVASSEVTS